MDKRRTQIAPAEGPRVSAGTEMPSGTYEESIRLRALPKEIGTLMLIVGIGGILLPGPVGTPFVLVGGLLLWPSAFQRIDDFFQTRFPRSHQRGMKQVLRYVRDLERRYPTMGPQ